MCRDRKPLYALGALSFVGFILIIVGGAVPNWRMQEKTILEQQDYHMGPFTICPTRDSNDDCERIDPREDGVTDEFRAIQAFVLLSIIFGLIGAIDAIFHGCKGSSMKTDGAILQVLAGLFGLIATALWVKYQTDNEKCEVIEDVFHKLHTCYWAFSMFTAGWCIELLAAVFMAFT